MLLSNKNLSKKKIKLLLFHSYFFFFTYILLKPKHKIEYIYKQPAGSEYSRYFQLFGKKKRQSR